MSQQEHDQGTRQPMKLFQINEDDLAELERTLPRITDFISPSSINGQQGNAIRRQIRVVQRILTDVRWGYVPPQEIEVIPAD